MIPQIRLDIVKTLVLSRSPMSVSDIAHEIGEPRQKVTYHIEPLIAQGLILPLNEGLLTTQSILRDERMFDLVVPLIYHVIEHIDASSASDREEAVANVLAYFFAIQEYNGDDGKENIFDTRL